MKNLLFLTVTLLFIGMISAQISATRPGIAAKTTWTDPAGIVHTYYLWKYNTDDKKTVPLSFCQSIAPADVRAAIPPGNEIYLATITSEAERAAVRDMVKSQKPPFAFSKMEAFWVDNAFVSNGKTWQSLSGECSKYIPWGDGCPPYQMEPANPVTDYCTTFDMRDDVLCKVGQVCDPANPSRRCFYDGVYNNIPCTATAMGCIFESQPFPIPIAQTPCRTLKCPNNQPSLILNGDFELGQYTDVNWDTFTAPSGSVFGWMLTDGMIDAVNAGKAWQAASGSRSIDMNGVVAGTLQQTLSLDKTKRKYTLNFMMSANPGGTPAITPMQVTIYTSGGQAVATQKFEFDRTGTSFTNMKWSPRSLDWVSIQGEGNYKLEFKSLMPSAAGPAIDAVTLCAGDVVQMGPCTAGAGSLLQNGEFEDGNFVPNSPVGAAAPFQRLSPASAQPNIGGWKITSGSVDWVNNAFFNRAALGKSIFFTGPTVNAATSNAAVNPSISQSFILSDSQSRIVTLKFNIYGYSQGAPIKRLAATVYNGNSILSTKVFEYNSAQVPAGQVVWQAVMMEFSTVAGQNTYTIRFVDLTVSGAFGMAIDGVTLCQGAVITVPPSPCTVGTNAVKNGDFTSGTATLSFSTPAVINVGAGNGEYDVVAPGSTAIANWEVMGAAAVYNSLAWINSNGPKSVHLAPPTATTPGTTLRQNITLTPNRIYTVTFMMAGNPWPGSTAPKSLRVSIVSLDGRMVTSQDFSFDNSKTSASAMGWTAKTFAFVTSSIYTGYQLMFTDTSRGPGGSVIDSVVICDSRESYNFDPCLGQKNFIVNPGFAPAPGQTHTGGVFDTLAPGSPRLAPWVITAGTVDHIYSLWQNDGNSSYSVDLDSKAAIRQPVKLDANAATYTLRFSLSGNPQGPTPIKTVTVNIRKSDNTVLSSAQFTFDVTGKTMQRMGWVSKSLVFQSAQGVTDYIVEFQGEVNTNFGPVLDNAFLCATTTPIPQAMRCSANTKPNLIRNGGFERNSIVLPVGATFVTLFPGSTALESWEITAGSIDVKYAGFWQQIEGKDSIDMTGTPGAGIIRQNVILPMTSTDYTLSWQMSGNSGAAPAIKVMDVRVYTFDGKMVATKTYTFDGTKVNYQNMGWMLTSMPFRSVQGVGSYYVEFVSQNDGFAGMAIDDVVLCGVDTPVVTNAELTVTADNTFEIYVDGQELVPTNAAQIAAACAGKPMSPASKYCCAAANLGPRCDWTQTETFPITVTNSSIIAVHVANFDGNHQNPFAAGGNPGGLLLQYKSGGRICAVSSSEWRCVGANGVSSADSASGAWTKYMYDDNSWTPAQSMGPNRQGAWIGTSGEKLYGGDSIWYRVRNNSPIPNIVPYAQMIWNEVASSELQMWCRLYVPTLYC